MSYLRLLCKHNLNKAHTVVQLALPLTERNMFKWCSHKTCKLPFCKWLRSELPPTSRSITATSKGNKFLNADTGRETDILFRCPCSTGLLETMFIVFVQQKYKPWCVFWQVVPDLVVIIHSTASGLPCCSRRNLYYKLQHTKLNLTYQLMHNKLT